MILFDHNIFFLQKYGGVSRYFIELFKQMELNKFPYFVQCSIHTNNYLKNTNLNKSYGLYLKAYPKFTRKIIRSINNQFLQFAVKKNKIKVFHNTYYGNYYFKNNISQILTIYDFVHEIFKNEYNYNSNIKKNSIINSAHMICISENTKKDLVNYYNVSSNDASVIHLGGDHLPKSNKTYKEKPFVLYVGFRENYKNFEILLKAFSTSEKLKKDFNIICFGSDKFNKEEISKIENFGLKNIVKHFNGNDQDLSNLYSSAHCHIITSKYEGFGITALEAYNFDCPVIHTGKGFLSEIKNNLGFYDGSSENLKHLLEQILYSNQDINKMIKSGNEIKKDLTWNNCFKKTIKIYEKFM